MRYFLIFLAGFFSLVSLPGFARESATAPEGKRAPRVIRFIFDAGSPPFAFKGEEDYAGFDIDLGEALGKKLGAEVRWINVPFDIRRYSNILEADGADAALAAITITRIRGYFVDFTRPYFSTTLAVATRPDVAWDQRAFARGLENKIVGVMKGTTGENWARDNLKAVIKTYDSPLSLIRALKRGGNLAFAVLIDEAILDYLQFCTASMCRTQFKIVEKGLSQEDYGIAVSNGDSDLLAALNTALRQLELDGEYDLIYEKWFGKNQMEKQPDRK